MSVITESCMYSWYSFSILLVMFVYHVQYVYYIIQDDMIIADIFCIAIVYVIPHKYEQIQ